jgi:hypothetical protein
MSAEVTSQPLQALAKANAIRFARAAMKRDIAARGYTNGHRHAADLIEAPPPFAETMKLVDLMKAIYHSQPTTRSHILQRLNCSADRRIGELTDRQRQLAARELRIAAMRNQRQRKT